MGVQLRESHWKDNWCVDLWSDGSIEVWSHHRRRKNEAHRLSVDTVLDGSPLPKYVVRMIAEAQALYTYEKES